MLLATAVAAITACAYALTLWWLLRRESKVTLLWLLVLCSVSLALRVVYTHDFPPGLDEHESRHLACFVGSYGVGRVFDECFGVPTLFNGAFTVPLVGLLGPSLWAFHGYSIVTGVLSTAAGFAVARALGLRVAPSLGVGGLIAVLPWSLLYSRTSMGTSLTFYQLILLAALARLIGGSGRWAEVGYGGLALCSLLYDSFMGRALLGMPVVAAVLARGFRRWLCLVIIAVAFLGYAPYFAKGSLYSRVGITVLFQSEGSPDALGELRRKAEHAAAAFVAPVASNYYFAVPAGAMHPPLVLILAGLGLLTGVRRGLLLLAGFLSGVAPTVVSAGPNPSSHRMIMAFPYIPIAAGALLDLLPGRWVRRAGTAVAVGVIGFQAVTLYFSNAFWPPHGRAHFDRERTDLAQALPREYAGRVIINHQLNEFANVDRFWSAVRIERLAVENWLPPDDTQLIYAFDQDYAALRPLYETVFGAARIESFGRAFLIRLEAGKWSWLRRYGWTYDMRCGEQTRVGMVPTLFHNRFGFGDIRCEAPERHRWRARWNGPASTLRLRCIGQAKVLVDSRVVVDRFQDNYFQTWSDFSVESGADLTVLIDPAGGLAAALMEITPAGERLPPWEWLTPAAADGAAEDRVASRRGETVGERK